MHVQEGFVGIAFHEVSRSGQFVGNFLHHWWGVILSDDGLVQWHAVQTGSHFSRRLYWICGTVNPWGWFYLSICGSMMSSAIMLSRAAQMASLLSIGTLRLACWTGPTLGSILMVYSPFRLPILLKEFRYIAVSCSLSLIKAPTGSWNIGFSAQRQLFH